MAALIIVASLVMAGCAQNQLTLTTSEAMPTAESGRSGSGGQAIDALTPTAASAVLTDIAIERVTGRAPTARF